MVASIAFKRQWHFNYNIEMLLSHCEFGRVQGLLLWQRRLALLAQVLRRSIPRVNLNKNGSNIVTLCHIFVSLDCGVDRHVLLLKDSGTSS